MRIGLISDVHSNAPALEEVLYYLEDVGVDKIVHAGDIIGYNPFPNEVINLMNRHKVESIRGNHEIIYLTEDVSKASHAAERALQWTKGVLTENNRRYIASLDDTLRFKVGEVSISVYHGSPADPWEYVEAVRATSELLEKAGTDILVLGHTHKPFVRPLTAGMIVNPGAVGQPRDRDPRTSLAILDPEKMEATIKRLTYDIERVRSKIEEEGLPRILGERLKIGK